MNKVSVVVPCYNEEGNVARMCAAIKDVLTKMSGYEWEILFIDNCSVDNTPNILRALAAEDKRVKVILNNRNFGPDMSGFYALTQASGDCIVCLPCDFQEPPEMLPKFVKKWEDGNRVVWGQRTSTRETGVWPFFRRIYYKLMAGMSSLPQYENVTGFGCIDRRVMLQLAAMRDPWPMLRTMIPQLGYTPAFLSYEQQARAAGKSSYNFFRYFHTALNALVHTSSMPLKLAIWTGAFFACGTAATGFFYLGYKLLHWDSFALGQAALIILVSFISSVQLIFLGILGEYVLLILRRVSFKRYVIEKERINFDV